MQKFCVFCGKKPQSKTKEHIIPKWLIELTGDPNRKAFFGFDLIPDKPRMRTYAFDSFSFPACRDCNSEFSDLESKAQKVVVSVLGNDKISDLDISCLLDWLDKIRVGLWLGFLTLSKNSPNITPKFYIGTRICTNDRLLFIYRLSTQRTGINFVGTESPSFMHIPSSFALLINNYCFFNVSHFNLCDRRLGFPYAKEVFYRDMKLTIAADLVKGFERIFFPVVKRYFLPNASKFYQPIFFHHPSNDDLRNLYDTEYVRSNSIDWEKGIGRVFHELSEKARVYPREKTHSWLPPSSHNLADFLPRINQQVYDFQIDVATGPSLDRLSKADRRYLREQINSYRRVNNLVINFVKEQLRTVRI